VVGERPVGPVPLRRCRVGLDGLVATHLAVGGEVVVALACELLAWTQMLALTGGAPSVGNPAAATADPLRRRAYRPRRPAPPAPHRRPMVLGRPDHRRYYAAPGPRTRLTSPNPSDRPGMDNRGQVEPRPPARQPGSQTDRTPGKGAQAAASGHQSKIEASAG
jgi:hypothetical protein